MEKNLDTIIVTHDIGRVILTLQRVDLIDRSFVYRPCKITINESLFIVLI